jgi:hypothetical protein
MVVANLDAEILYFVMVLTTRKCNGYFIDTFKKETLSSEIQQNRKADAIYRDNIRI